MKEYLPEPRIDKERFSPLEPHEVEYVDNHWLRKDWLRLHQEVERLRDQDIKEENERLEDHLNSSQQANMLLRDQIMRLKESNAHIRVVAQGLLDAVNEWGIPGCHWDPPGSCPPCPHCRVGTALKEVKALLKEKP